MHDCGASWERPPVIAASGTRAGTRELLRHRRLFGRRAHRSPIQREHDELETGERAGRRADDDVEALAYRLACRTPRLRADAPTRRRSRAYGDLRLQASTMTYMRALCR